MFFVDIRKGVSIRAAWPGGDIWQCLETFEVVTARGDAGISSGWRPEILLNIPHCTGHPPNKEGSTVSRLRNADRRDR